ncbi:MAG TPA: glycerophosphodiester phosphodiesterase family protein [Tepidisphaeraceae bacterium]|jgi:glycerophosphoryl diester phosphodiesterase
MNKIALLISLLALVNFAQGEEPVSDHWTVKGHIPLERFVIQSHRGAGELAPENTIEAFELGWKLGTVPECDLRTTKDGVIVTFHDENFGRVVVGASEELKKKGVKDVTFDEVKKLDVGQGRHVITISQAFEAMKDKPERRMYLDIKNVDLDQLARLAKEAGVENRVILASTKYDIIQHWKKLVPDGQTLLWMGGDEPKLVKRIEELRKNDFAAVTQLQIHIHPEVTTSNVKLQPSDRFLLDLGKELRSRGILFQTLPYAKFDPRIYHRLLDLGVQSFATDQPDQLLAAVKEYYKQ